jgi:aspartyl-tRNA synthetase
MKKTHHCSQLTKADIGKNVSLIGWINPPRDHGGVLFVDIRDSKGITQVVFDPNNKELGDIHHNLKPESVIEIKGEVKERSEDTINPNIPTGEIEVHAQHLIIHNVSRTLPFPLTQGKTEKTHEDLRLSYRYLDLRRARNLEIMQLRHKAAKATRDYLNDSDFIEVETPILFKSTPEGAREFLVPSRLNPGEFYALAQSPQQYKQMLMVAGVERYYQLARCFRDEDLRADRQPEFTQIDIEISFIDRKRMYLLIEGLLKHIWKETLHVDIDLPFPKISYQEAMDRYGSDKPDTRFPLEINDLTSTFKNSAFKVFAETIKKGGVIKAFNAKGLADITQGELKTLEQTAISLGAKGLAFIKAENNQWKSPILKFLSEQEKTTLKQRLDIQEGDIVFFSATQWTQACTILGRIRLEVAQLLSRRGKLKIPNNAYHFLWVTDFPLLLFDEEQGRYVSAHHPFTAPVPEDIEKLETNPKSVHGQHYDIVLNGVELGGGSIRIHQSQLQRKVFEKVLKIAPQVIENRFGYMLEAFSYGAPPHGGIALGFDRLVAILAKTKSIRDVIAFPKTQKGQCLMSKSPGPVKPEQLREVYLESLSI